MKERVPFYKCELCGNIIGLIKDGGGTLVCCGQPMAKIEPGTIEASKEKHIPVCKKDGGKVCVQVGSEAHPMTDEHLIEWIVLEEANKTQRVMLKQGDEPKAEFCVNSDDFAVFAYCNIHGLWKG